MTIKGHNFKFDFTNDEVIKDIKRVASIIGKNTITAKEYNIYGIYHSSTLINHYGSWNYILKMAGFKVNLNRNFSDEELLAEIERIWIKLGRQPTSTDIKNGASIYSFQSFARRFGGWRGALTAFIEYINKDSDKELSVNTETVRVIINDHETINNFLHKTNREVNLRLRFKVMQRDNFKCCLCGASPSKDPSVELQVDHIIPWSKGGETTIDNLQTLCFKCNNGKSDIL